MLSTAVYMDRYILNLIYCKYNLQVQVKRFHKEACLFLHPHILISHFSIKDGVDLNKIINSVIPSLLGSNCDLQSRLQF